MKKPVVGNGQIGVARKEIRANIRRTLTDHEFRSRLNTGLANTMDELLEHESHPVNKLFALGRLDRTKADHWRFLTFIMVEEIFGLKRRGAPTKDTSPLKNLELLVYLNEIHRMRVEDGYPSGVAHAVEDLPALFSIMTDSPDTQVFVERYKNLDSTSLKDYAHRALTDGAKLLKSKPGSLASPLAKTVETALDNFRPGWRQTKT